MILGTMILGTMAAIMAVGMILGASAIMIPGTTLGMVGCTIPGTMAIMVGLTHVTITMLMSIMAVLLIVIP